MLKFSQNFVIFRFIRVKTWSRPNFLENSREILRKLKHFLKFFLTKWKLQSYNRPNSLFTTYAPGSARVKFRAQAPGWMAFEPMLSKIRLRLTDSEPKLRLRHTISLSSLKSLYPKFHLNSQLFYIYLLLYVNNTFENSEQF